MNKKMLPIAATRALSRVGGDIAEGGILEFLFERLQISRLYSLVGQFCLAFLVGLLSAGAVSGVQAQTLAPGIVVGWGNNSNGQTAIPPGLTGVAAIAAGALHSLALKNDGTVVAWGDNAQGQTNIPSGLTGVTAIAAGNDHSLALKNDGTVVGWGSNYFGETTIPAGLTDVKVIAAGANYGLALKRDGTVVGWGDNSGGQTTIPPGLTGVTAIAAGALHSLALKSDGTVVAWGSNQFAATTIPAGLTGVTAIAARFSHSLALKSDGTVVAWGDNAQGQATVPPSLTGVTAIATGGYHNLALKNDGTVVGWGYNGDGETNIPAGLTGVTAIAGGVYHNLAANLLPELQPFAAFVPYLSIIKGALPNTDKFGFGATLTLAANGRAFDASKDPVTLQFGSSAALTLPAGSFKPNGFGGFVYLGQIGTMPFGASLQPQGGGKYVAGIGASGANLTGVANPVAATLTIGTNRGQASVTAQIVAAKVSTPTGSALTSPFGP